MDFQSAMETFVEAWVAANTQSALTETAETQSILMSGGVSGGNCMHEVNQERREKQESSMPVDPSNTGGLRSPGSAPPLVEHRPMLRIPLKTNIHQGRSIPVHCVVEQVTPQGQATVDSPQGGSTGPQAAAVTVDCDNYAIIPSNVLFSELVRSALTKLGYSASEAVAAKAPTMRRRDVILKVFRGFLQPEADGADGVAEAAADALGAIQLKNWKPLTFDQITESPEATVGDILGELSTVATLRIRLYSRPKLQGANDVKEKLLQVLLAQSQNMLVNSGCPIDQNMLAALTKDRLEGDIPEETRKKFDQWYLQQVFQHCRQVAILQQQHQQQQQQHLHHHSHHPHMVPPGDRIAVSNSPPHSSSELVAHVTMASSQSQGRTRIRTSFDPELELPKLHRWFAENQHPSRLQIQQYVRELNSLESRRGRKPLDVNNVVYWFKNARAAHKRAEQKCFMESNGLRSPGPETATENRSLGLEMSSDRPMPEQEGERYSGAESHSESQNNSSDDSDNVHTLDLSVRRCHNGDASGEREQELRIKEEPRDSSSDHSMDSSESGDEEVDVMEDMTMNTEESDHKGDFDNTTMVQQNGGVSGRSYIGNQEGESEHQQNYPERVLVRLEERRKRNRTFIDPVSEVPRLEQWFSANTHPAHSQIVSFTQELNSMQYRQKFPKLEPKNIQFWFKNRRAKCKRLSLAALQNVVTTCAENKVAMASN